MKLESKKIEEIYSSEVAKEYGSSMARFEQYKEKAINESSLKNGDIVLVFCCGTGLDFSHILKKIGKEGKILGVDFSSEMLKKAKEIIRNEKWENIELIEADITKFKDKLEEKADVGVCTLGMSIIPDFKSAYHNLLSNVKEQGEIIIGDMQLASGRLAGLKTKLTISLAKKYGGTYEGHQNSLELYSMMKKELTDIIKREFLLKSYFYCIGEKK